MPATPRRSGRGCSPSTPRSPLSPRSASTPRRPGPSRTARPRKSAPTPPAPCECTDPTTPCSGSASRTAARCGPNGSSMRILHGLPSFPPDLLPSVVALGTFDGVHLAHAKILATAVRRARELGVSSVVCTFDRNPAAVLRPDRAPAPIATLEENLERIAAHGPDAALVIPFTPELSKIEAEAFVDEVLLKRLGAREVVVGFNHTFGRGALGTAELLRTLGARRGFAVHVLPPLEVDGQVVSSSAIRAALREGDV